MATAKAKQQKKAPVNIDASLRNDGNTLLITADLSKSAGTTKNGKGNVFATTQSPQRLNHPRIADLYYMVKVVQRLTNTPPELQQLLDQRRQLKEKIKQYRAQRAAAKK